jgi:uncharacterized protein (DUF433 family)
MTENWRNRITVNQDILSGKPIVKGTRLAVEFIMELLSNGWTEEKIMKNYPQLKNGDVTAVLKYATEVMKEEKVYPLLDSTAC